MLDQRFRNTLEIYKKYTAPGQLPIFKKEFYNRHKDDIEKHITARAYIYDKLKLEKFPSMKKLSTDISALYAEEKVLRERLSATQKDIRTLNTINHNVNMLFGYRELEKQDINPVAVTKDPRLVPVCKSSFVEAEKAGATQAYFQSRNLNKDCAEAIQQAISKNKKGERYDMETAANEVVAAYGRERAEWTVAAMIDFVMTGAYGKPPDNFLDHKEWAAQKKMPDEPHGITPVIRTDLLNDFIKTFKKVARLSPSLMYMDSKDLTIADKLAIAGRKVKEQDQNKSTQPPHKSNKKNDYEL